MLTRFRFYHSHLHLKRVPLLELPCLCFSAGRVCLWLKISSLSQVTGVSVSPGKDQLVVFHTKDSRDLVVCLQGMVPANESRIGELVGALLSHFKR